MQEALLQGIGGWINSVGNAIYEGRPCGVLGARKDFALRASGKLYFFVHDLAIRGNENVTVEGGGYGTRTFKGLNDKVSRVRWTDNGEELAFTQNAGEITVDCTGYPYGTDLVVRIAEADIV